jgi:hypothetical protein
MYSTKPNCQGYVPLTHTASLLLVQGLSLKMDHFDGGWETLNWSRFVQYGTSVRVSVPWAIQYRKSIVYLQLLFFLRSRKGKGGEWRCSCKEVYRGTAVKGAQIDHVMLKKDIV